MLLSGITVKAAGTIETKNIAIFKSLIQVRLVCGDLYLCGFIIDAIFCVVFNNYIVFLAVFLALSFII